VRALCITLAGVALLGGLAWPTPGWGEADHYRNTDEIHELLHETAAEYPSITELVDYGDSYLKVSSGGTDGYDLLALKITNQEITGPKPVFFLVANYHGRELPSYEVALRWIEWLVLGHGSDPDATWLVDWHELWVVPTVNPDRCMISRHNANGVDLNRNHDFAWVAHESHGAYPRSEPEIAGLEDLILDRIPDQRGPDDTDAAPVEATGIYVTLHTPLGTIGHPWAWTSAAAPNADDLAAVGDKLAVINGYDSGPSNDVIYPMNGCGTDWAYGTLGIAALIIELAPAHNPDYELIDAEIWPLNHEVLIYAAKLARTPYLTARGPDAHGLEVVPLDGALHISALIDDLENGAAEIESAELYIDDPPWSDTGTPQPLSAEDGAFDSPVELVTGEIGTDGLAPGRHLALVQGTDADGDTGPPSAVFFVVSDAIDPDHDAGSDGGEESPPDAGAADAATDHLPGLTAIGGGCECRTASASGRPWLDGLILPLQLLFGLPESAGP
jgi:hypothetical protein